MLLQLLLQFVPLVYPEGIRAHRCVGARVAAGVAAGVDVFMVSAAQCSVGLSRSVQCRFVFPR